MAAVSTPAPPPPSLSRVQMNGECYTGTSEYTMQAFGDVATMGLTGMGALFTCICVVLFAYISSTTPSVVPMIITACCVGSMCTSLGKYYMARTDLSSLKDSGKITPCPVSA